MHILTQSIRKQAWNAGNVGIGLSVVASLAVFACSLLLFRLRGTIPDTSWLLTVIDRMNAGDRLYTDIIEVNPPFSIWLYMPPYYAARFLGTTPELAAHIYTFLICLLGVWVTCWMMLAAKLADRAWLRIAFPALLALTVLLAGNSFTERDQIGAVLALPLLVLSQWRTDIETKDGPGPRHWLVAGLLGSVLPLVKPYYALVWISVGLWVAFRRRNPRMIFLPDFLLPASVCVIYLAGIYLAYPLFFETFLPLLEQTYLAFRQPFYVLLAFGFPLYLLTFAKVMLPASGVRRDLSNLLFIASLSAWIPYFYQGKGWAYHIYPAILFGSLAVLVPLCLAPLAGPGGARRDRPSRLQVFLALVAILFSYGRFAQTENPPDRFVAAIRKVTDHPTVAMLGGDIAAAHPLTRLLGGRWIEPYCSDWIIVFAVRMEKKARQAHDTAREKDYVAMAREYGARKLERFLANPPEIILVDKWGPTASILMEESGFGDVLDSYRKIADSERMTAYKRIDGPAPVVGNRNGPASGNSG